MKSTGNVLFNLNSLAHPSHQNLGCLPFQIWIVNLKLNSSQPFVISFQMLISKESLTPLVVQRPSISLNFP